MGEIFGTDGIRDRAGNGWLALPNVTRLARAAGHILKDTPARFRSPGKARRWKFESAWDAPDCGQVLIGRDTRASGPDIEQALADGFRSMGVSVGLLGIITTPGVSLLTAMCKDAKLGVVISASHNPAEDNGIKFVSTQGFKIPDAAEAAVEKLLKGGAIAPRAKKPKAPGDVARLASNYLDFLAQFSRPLKGMKIVADCGHGAASAFAGPLFRRLGAKVVVLNAAPDGQNINAGCGALHPEKVAAAVKAEKADVGVAFDGDADRLILVDETGAVRDGETVLALCGLHLKEKKALPGNAVVSTVMANFGFERHLASHGITLRRTKVGDRYVAEDMLQSGAVLGGEPSGHVLFFDASPAGDGMLTALRVLDTLVERKQKLSQAAFAKFPQVLINVRVAKKPPIEDVPALRAAVAAAEKELGEDGRILVRYSGTESICRVMVEGPTDGLVNRVAGAVADTVKKELA
jgi:phosphoglucosamine mutase